MTVQSRGDVLGTSSGSELSDRPDADEVDRAEWADDEGEGYVFLADDEDWPAHLGAASVGVP